MFQRMGAEPVTLINAMCLFEVALIAAQFWMLVLTTDWQHIVTLVLLMFANYLLLAKVSISGLFCSFTERKPNRGSYSVAAF